MVLCFDKDVPNKDKTKLWAKHIRGADERIEIRTSQFGAETVIIVYKHRKLTHDSYMAYGDHWDVRISTNGKMHFSFNDWQLLNQAVEEARVILGN